MMHGAIPIFFGGIFSNFLSSILCECMQGCMLINEKDEFQFCLQSILDMHERL